MTAATTSTLPQVGTATAKVAVKRGINLGCGKMIMPREKPAHHGLIPDNVYTDSIVWDNVDSAELPGVDKVIDLFDYPWRHHINSRPDTPTWRTAANPEMAIPDDTYDVALATHLCEHIPHAVMRGGRVVATTGGWWAWWDELGRVLKPGGVAHILVPYGFSRGGFIDPTHTRYIIPETFGYFVPDPNAPFDYGLKYRWDAIAQPLVGFTPMAYHYAKQEFGNVEFDSLSAIAQKYNNAISEFSISLRCSRV
jgi:SAM-dependent methyltransferase